VQLLKLPFREQPCLVGLTAAACRRCPPRRRRAGKRLESVGVENTEENRRDWRQLLYTAPGGRGALPAVALNAPPWPCAVLFAAVAVCCAVCAVPCLESAATRCGSARQARVPPGCSFLPSFPRRSWPVHQRGHHV
jgi:hypothetical protein